MQSSLYNMAEGGGGEALAAANKALSPRQRELEVLERFALGTQYEGLPDWFACDDVPLWERAPCIVDPIIGSAIRSNTDLVLGESRFPTITSNPGEDDSDAEGLDKTESETVDRAIAEVVDRIRFRTVSRQALTHGQQSKSVAGIFAVRKGKLSIELVRSRWCEPTLDECGAVVSLEIRYPYLDWYKQPDGKWRVKAWLYRRIIDAANDTTYSPVECSKDGSEPSAGAWVPSLVVTHGLGFCPVHWYAHMRESSTVADYDGEALHENVLDEKRGLDFALSQEHRAALFLGEPQIVETNVDPRDMPGDLGREAQVGGSKYGGTAGGANAGAGHFAAGGPATARRKGPGQVWSYTTDAKVAYLLLPEGSLDVIATHAQNLRNKVAEALSAVILDPQNLKLSAALSGKAIEQLRSRQFDRCDAVRDDIGEGWILPAIKMALRIALKLNLPMPAVRKARAALAKFVTDADDAPLLFCRWRSPYVKPDPADESLIVTETVAAKDAGLITRTIAVTKLAPIFGITSVAQVEEELDEQKEQDKADALDEHKHQLEMVHATGAALDGGKPDPKPTPDVP